MKNTSLKMGLTMVTLLAVWFMASSTAMAAESGASTKLRGLSWQEDPFTNEDVLTMIQAGFEQETIVEAIRSSEPGFDTSVEGLVALKEAGVGEEIIVEILAAAERPKTAVPSAPGGDADGLPSEEGVYALKEGVYVPLADERIEWRSGFFSGITTSGKKRTTAFNARLKALHSPFEVSSTPEILVVCEECESKFDYHLVLANDEDDKREFRISFQLLQPRHVVGLPLSDETYVCRGGTGKEKMEYDAESGAPGRYKLMLPELVPAEYGFLPPSEGDHPQSSSGSVMYTFRLIAK